MARVGIGEALIGNIFLDDIPAGKVKVLSEEWWGLVEHAIREGGRVGVNIGMFNCPGWSQSGGPWIKPEQAMRYLVSSETRVKGPVRLNQDLPGAQRAVPGCRGAGVPRAGEGCRHARDACAAPHLLASRGGCGKAGRRQTGDGLRVPGGGGSGQQRFTIELEVGEPFTARSLSLVPGESAWAAKVRTAGGARRWPVCSRAQLQVRPLEHGDRTSGRCRGGR